MNISKYTLGTVQLGLEYGIANKSGKPSIHENDLILNLAIDNGISSFDTAPTYGNSEKILGRFFNKKIQKPTPVVITKIPQIELTKKPVFSEIYQKIKSSVKNSIDRLGLEKIPICLLHSPTDMLRYDGLIVESLSKLKEEGLVDMIGVSVYTPDEVRTFLTIKEFDVIQIPLNIFDTRLIKNGLLEQLVHANKIVFARSIFLQGLFFLEPENLPPNLKMVKKYLKELQNISLRYKISIQRLALVFVRDTLGIDSLIFGVETADQLRKNIDMLQSPSLPDEVIQVINQTFSHMPEKIINPIMWEEKKNESI